MQEKAFTDLKEELSIPTILSLYNTTIHACSSNKGFCRRLNIIMGWEQLLQEDKSMWKPVAYTSRSMSETEQRYAQIEKEALAITWICEKL